MLTSSPEAGSPLRILWLASWFPNDERRLEGDFVERMALAVASFVRVDVVTCQLGSDSYTTTEQVTKTLSIQRVYRKSSLSGWRRAALLTNLYRLKVDECCARVSYDAVHVHVIPYAGLGGLYAKLKYKLPLIVSEHASLYLPANANSFSASLAAATRIIGSQADACTAVSSTLLESLQTLGFKQRMEVIPNVVQGDLFHPPIRDADRPYRFIHVSSLHPIIKRPQDILEAARQLRRKTKHPFVISMIGDSKHLSTLHDAAHRLCVHDIIEWSGYVSHVEISDLLRRSSCVVMPSAYETFGCVLAEAFATGIPVISSGVNAFNRRRQPETGYEVPVGDSSALANAMQRMLEQRRPVDSKKLRNLVLPRCSSFNIGRRFYELYHELVADQRNN